TLAAIGDAKVDWLVVDHYALDARWEKRLQVKCNHLMVIDDLADRSHLCDVLLDQSLHCDSNARYQSLVSRCCRQFLGPSYALLRPEFYKMRSISQGGDVRRVHVYFGGNDLDNQAGRAINALIHFPQLAVYVVLGLNHPHRESVFEMTKSFPWITVTEVCHNMVATMADADLALGVCGGAAWERCALGLPTLVCITADNQRDDAESLHRLGAVENLGESADVDTNQWIRALSRVLDEPLRISRMRQAARAIVAGNQECRHELLDTLLDYGS
ncbi:MAG: UDP-2,4-diacetamido-2,4,6-trideoxy-beta-L-altropyranose hydrolase, partial [Zetaproteobacteria bacterium]|nr:UDP-2,4-diacetamido-2,4,6-trideoxy-beta-L-altropyranose hydrolase [Zetaproteobacteria bacterium]